MSSPHVGILCGENQKPAKFLWRGIVKYVMRFSFYPSQFDCPFHNRPAAIDVELAENALGLSPHRAQRDDKFLSDLGIRQLGLESAQDVQLTLTERLDQGS